MPTLASNTTVNIGLSQWSATDYVRREDFNADNALIDAAFGNAVQIDLGTYVGTGANGDAYTPTLNFDFTPKLVYISMQNDTDRDSLLIINGQITAGTLTTDGGLNMRPLTLTWGDNSVSWVSGAKTSAGAKFQLNESAVTYCYFAIG